MRITAVRITPLFLPLRLDLHDGGSVIGAVLGSVVSSPEMALGFLTAMVALALTSANSPNWFALITEVNPPEHRGTVYSLGNLANGIGRAVGNYLSAQGVQALGRSMPQASSPASTGVARRADRNRSRRQAIRRFGCCAGSGSWTRARSTTIAPTAAMPRSLARSGWDRMP